MRKKMILGILVLFAGLVSAAGILESESGEIQLQPENGMVKVNGSLSVLGDIEEIGFINQDYIEIEGDTWDNGILLDTNGYPAIHIEARNENYWPQLQLKYFNDYSRLYHHSEYGLLFRPKYPNTATANFAPYHQKKVDFGRGISWDDCYCDDFVNTPRDLTSLRENNRKKFKITTKHLNQSVIYELEPEVDIRKHKRYEDYLSVLRDIPYDEDTGQIDMEDIPLMLRDKQLNPDTLSTYALMMANRNSILELEKRIIELEEENRGLRKKIKQTTELGTTTIASEEVLK